MIYVGIDPGKSGAIAVIFDGMDETMVVPFGEREYINVLCNLSGHNVKTCLEHVTAMPKQGVTSMFNFGVNFGYIRGVLEAYSIPYELVRPQKWKKEFSITGDKNTSLEVCRRLFPNVCLRRTDKCRKDDDGMAEALLMAEYARRHLSGA